MAENKSQRTEQPTHKKLEDAKRKGNVARSQEVSHVFVLGALLLFGHLAGPHWMEQVKGLMQGAFSNLPSADLNSNEFLRLVRSIGAVTMQLLLLPVGAMALASVGGNVIQGSLVLTFDPVKPDFSKMNPVKGMKKVFSVKSLVTLLKALMKVTLFCVIAIDATLDVYDAGLGISPGTEGTLQAIFFLAGKVIFRVTMVWLVLALADVMYTRWNHNRDQRMTKQEVKDERKQQDGDPKIKQRIKQKQFEVSRKRMMSKVPDATVVITNPTHYAVAIQYLPGDAGVPQVVAKGQNLIAKRIREMAIEHGVPIVEEPPLARALYGSVELGAFVPENLFRAVAEVLAMVMKRHRGTGQPTSEQRP